VGDKFLGEFKIVEKCRGDHWSSVDKIAVCHCGRAITN